MDVDPQEQHSLLATSNGQVTLDEFTSTRGEVQKILDQTIHDGGAVKYTVLWENGETTEVRPPYPALKPPPPSVEGNLDASRWNIDGNGLLKTACDRHQTWVLVARARLSGHSAGILGYQGVDREQCASSKIHPTHKKSKIGEGIGCWKMIKKGVSSEGKECE